MRIAFVSLHTSPVDSPGAGDAGGMNVVESHQAAALADRGHQVELITRRSSPDVDDIVTLHESATGGSVRLRHLTAGPTRHLAKSAQPEWIGDFGAELARWSPPDVYFSQHWMSGLAALPVARARHVPHVQGFHSIAAQRDRPLAEGEPPESPLRVGAEATLSRESDLVVAVSNFEARTVIERCGGDPAKVVVIRPGVDGELFRPRPDVAEQVLFAARLQPLKGPELAIRALAKVPSSRRPDLVVVGDISEDFADYGRELDALVDELGLGSKVQFVGPKSRAELAELMGCSRLLLVPSHSETFGLVALEAAAAGCPVLASGAGGLAEAVADGVSGRLLTDRDPATWGRAIDELCGDRDAWQRLRAGAREYANSFRWDDVAARLEVELSSLVNR